MDILHPPFRSPDRHGLSALDEGVLAATYETGDPLSWEALSESATLVMTPDGSPIRTIVTGLRPITTGIYASRKAGRPLPYESMVERAFFMHSEVDTTIVDYRAQPFRFEFNIDGRKRTYIVDCLRLRADQTIEIVEIKSDRRALRDPDYAMKLEAVRVTCERVGWAFRVVFASTLTEPKRFYKNVVEVQSWRFTAFGQADEYIVTQALRRQPGMTLGDLGDALGARLPGIAKLKAMMVKRIVKIDLSHPLNLETPVELVCDQLEPMQ